ncbi:MAG: tetratricopeptide repeat protein [Terracidiphilus sp.]
MKLRFYLVLGFGCGLIGAVGLQGQAAPPAQQKPPASTQPQQPAQKPTEANPFPEDTNNVPVVPTSGEPAPAAPPAATSSNGESTVTTSLLKDDSDPVHSPDDSALDASGSDSGFSSSLTGSNDVNIPDEAKPTGRRKLNAPDTVHQETAKEDEDVGAFELSRKNWKAALSRFQSALVTDPENPEVYWGMAEAQRALGDFAGAKSNYQKVMDYDPDSKHGKEAKRLLKDPQLANAPAVSANHAAAQTPPK